MATLQIDDDTFAAWRREAAAQGQSVLEWLVGRTTPASDSVRQELTRDQWVAWLREFAGRQRATGDPMDDSRESIYD